MLDVDGEFAGFVVTMTAGREYDSPYYGWFTEHVDGFYYLDRIVLAPRIGAWASAGSCTTRWSGLRRRTGGCALEVNLVPRNDASLAFHASRGYVEVGRLGDDEHLVSLMEKPL